MNQTIRSLLQTIFVGGLLSVGSVNFAQERPAALKPWTEEMRSRYENLLLRDWNPQRPDHVAVTRVAKARFPVIDVHNHIEASRDPASLDQAIAEMDAANVRTVVALTCGWEATLQRNIDELAGRFPGRFLICTQVDINSIDAPNFTETAIERLREAKRMGAVGIKFRKDLGCYLKDRTGSYVAVNDSRFDAVWDAAGKLGLPVMIHVADPIAFFQPWDEKNPAYPKLLKNPAFYFHGPDWAGTMRFTHDELLQQFEDILTRFPETTFCGLHYASLEHDFERLSSLLDKHPNLLIETGARNWTLGIKPNSGRKFALRYQDRIMFGTDMRIDRAVYERFFRTLETDDDNIETDLSWGTVHGIHLPDEVLEKIYRKNAMKLFGLNE